MKLAEALNLLKRPAPVDARPLKVFLACGCTPLHLRTFLAAHLRSLAPDCAVEVEVGLYGDCLGNLGRLPASGVDAGAVVLEWPDFDPRLGRRQLGGWGPGVLEDILRTVEAQAGRFLEAIGRAVAAPLAVCLPTLPVPPVAYTPPRQAGAFDLRLREILGAFAAAAGGVAGVTIVSPQRLDVDSPPGDRLDVRSELTSGFPYRLPHASIVAAMLARLIRPPAPRKGLITDLDDTLWRGVLGDAGPRGISWDLDHASHAHALYQQMLAALADAGVLLAVASKNAPETVEAAFRREDLILTKDRLYPIEAHWEPKSGSVGRILRAWNVGADSVVFVDDSPMELAEVAAAHPGIECLAFPGRDEQAVYELLGRLRELFGKDRVAAEDALRLDSLRRSESLREAVGRGEADADAFLAQAEAVLILDESKETPDPRLHELIQKTNQFNLNGLRWTEAEWRAYLDDPSSFLLAASYRDKYGPLGTIAVLAGRRRGDVPVVESWVLSCRAFSRRIEHRCLEQLFERFGADEIAFDFRPTARNKPIQDFFATLLGHPPEPGFRLSRGAFAARCPSLHHQVEVPSHA